jgi:hypothetical protein
VVGDTPRYTDEMTSIMESVGDSITINIYEAMSADLWEIYVIDNTIIVSCCSHSLPINATTAQVPRLSGLWKHR